MSKSKVKKKDINLASFEEKLPNVAFSLFREWTKNATVEYPNLDFTIIDESVLVKDFRECLQNSFVSLFENQKYKTGNYLFQWDYGFILGFVEGNLAKHWYHEYIQKHNESREFLNLILLKY